MPDSLNAIQVGNVSFEPGARTNWHYHPAGQILIAIEGLGYYKEKERQRGYCAKAKWLNVRRMCCTGMVQAAISSLYRLL